MPQQNINKKDKQTKTNHHLGDITFSNTAFLNSKLYDILYGGFTYTSITGCYSYSESQIAQFFSSALDHGSLIGNTGMRSTHPITP